MSSTFTGDPAPPIPPPRAPLVLRAFLRTLGLGLLALGCFGVMMDSGSMPSWEATYSLQRSELPGTISSGTAITSRGGKTAQSVYSLMLMCGVGLIAASRGVDLKQYSLRALLTTVLLIGAAGSLPYILIRPLAMQATVRLEYKPFLPPAERARVIACLRRDTVLAELSPADKHRFDRVRFSVKTEEIGETGLRIILGFPESTPPALRDSITAYCGQYAQVLIHERLPWISQEALAEDVLRSEWTQTSSYRWEQEYRQRREEAKRKVTPQPQRPPP